MEFISAEDFLKQSDKVQKVFFDWMNDNLNEYDLIWWNGNIDLYRDYIDRLEEDQECLSFVLLNESQLRKFIEDKTEYRVDYCLYEGTYDINICENNGLYIKKYEDIDKDLLQAYWKVAIQIAENL